MNDIFTPELIDPTETRSQILKDALGLRIVPRYQETKSKEPSIYAEFIISDWIIADMAAGVGERVTFGIANDQSAVVIVPRDDGWKIAKHGKNTVHLQVKADKIGLGQLAEQALTPLTHIRYDKTLVVDITPMARKWI